MEWVKFGDLVRLILEILRCINYLSEAGRRIYSSLYDVIVASDNDMLLVRRQAITWTNIDLSAIRLYETYFNVIFIRKSNVFIQ